MVDNASTDETSDIVSEFSTGHPNISVRVVKEQKLGTGYARQRGMKEALHDLILFVDDDNWLDPDYLSVVAETMRRNPGIAALGGMSSAHCEGPEPHWLTKYQEWYAVTGPPSEAARLMSVDFLWTAGSTFRREAVERVRSLKLPFLVAGRRGTSLDAGEDEELCHLIRLSGGQLFRHPGLHFRHYLPSRRLTWDYLRRLNYAGGMVSVELDAYRFNNTRSIWPSSILQLWSAQVINVCFQILRYRIALTAGAEEGSRTSLRLAAYRGRLRALWRGRREYKNLMKHKAVLTGLIRRSGIGNSARVQIAG